MTTLLDMICMWLKYCLVFLHAEDLVRPSTQETESSVAELWSYYPGFPKEACQTSRELFCSQIGLLCSLECSCILGVFLVLGMTDRGLSILT